MTPLECYVPLWKKEGFIMLKRLQECWDTNLAERELSQKSAAQLAEELPPVSYRGYPQLSPARTELCELVLADRGFRTYRVSTMPGNDINYPAESYPSMAEVRYMLRKHEALWRLIDREWNYFHCFDLYQYGEDVHIVGFWMQSGYAMTEIFLPNSRSRESLMPDLALATTTVMADKPKFWQEFRNIWMRDIIFAGNIIGGGVLAAYAFEGGFGIAQLVIGGVIVGLSLLGWWQEHKRRCNKIDFGLFPLLRKECPQPKPETAVEQERGEHFAADLDHTINGLRPDDHNVITLEPRAAAG